MPETCRCGVSLVDGAVFCHKCGTPLREIPEPDSTGSMPVIKIEPVYPPVNFHNSIAVRVAFMMALAATVAFALPLVNWAAAGFFASLLYRRRTGYLLSLEAGLRIGWITGLFTFFIALIMMSVTFIFIQVGGIESLPADLRTMMRPLLQEVIRVFENPPSIVEVVILNFVSILLACMGGGALGARLTRRDSEGPVA